VIVVAETGNDPVSAPEGTVIDCGRLKMDRLAAVKTTAPSAGAAAESVTLQVMLDPDVSGFAGQVSDFSWTAPIIWIDTAEDDPFSDAVTVTVRVDVTHPPAEIPTKAAVWSGATVTEAGTTGPPSADATAIATTAPAAGAAADRVTLQVMLVQEAKLVAGHVSEVTLSGGVAGMRVIEAVADDPFNEAVTVAAEVTVNAPVFRVNDPLDAPCGSRIDAGTVADGELDASETVAPPVPAAPLRATEQAVEFEGAIEVLLHFTEVKVSGGVAGMRVIEAVADDPFNEAVTVAAEVTVNAPVLRVNDPLDAPCGSRIDAGTVADGKLDASETVAPPVPAAPLRATEQAVELEGAIELLLQFTEVTVTGAENG
jgi:hypothetical protein